MLRSHDCGIESVKAMIDGRQSGLSQFERLWHTCVIQQKENHTMMKLAGEALLVVVVLSLAVAAQAEATCPDLLREGEEAFFAMRYDEAVFLLDQAASRREECSRQQVERVYVTAARAAIARDDLAGAVKRFKEALRLNPFLRLEESSSPRVFKALDQARQELEQERAQRSTVVEQPLVQSPLAPDPTLPSTPANDPPAAVEPTGMSPQRIAAWSTLGAGGTLGIGSGIALAIAYQEDVAQREAAADHEWDSRDAHWENVKTYATTSYILAGVGGASLVTSLVLFLTDDGPLAANDEDHHFALAPILSPERQGVMVQFRF